LPSTNTGTGVIDTSENVPVIAARWKRLKWKTLSKWNAWTQKKLQGENVRRNHAANSDIQSCMFIYFNFSHYYPYTRMGKRKETHQETHREAK